LTATGTSELSAGRLSTSTVRISDLDSVLQKHKELSDLKDAKNSKRVSHIERQLNRITDLETQLDAVETDFGLRFNLFESRITETVMDDMNSNFEKLMNVVAKLVNKDEASAENNTPTVASSDAVDFEVPMNIVDEPLDQDPSNLKTSREKMAGTELFKHF
jgi:hypothetical protein